MVSSSTPLDHPTKKKSFHFLSCDMCDFYAAALIFFGKKGISREREKEKRKKYKKWGKESESETARQVSPAKSFMTARDLCYSGTSRTSNIQQ